MQWTIDLWMVMCHAAPEFHSQVNPDTTLSILYKVICANLHSLPMPQRRCLHCARHSVALVYIFTAKASAKQSANDCPILKSSRELTGAHYIQVEVRVSCISKAYQ